MSVCRTTSFCKKASASFLQAVTLDGRKKNNKENGKEEMKKGKEGGREEGKKRTGEIIDLDLFYFLSMSSQLISFDALLYKTSLNETKLLFTCLGTGSPSVASAGINLPISAFQVLRSWV